MNTRKTLGYGTQSLLCAIAIMLTMAFIACDDGSITSGGGNPTTITYTVTQDGGVDGTTTSTGIKFAFSASVSGLTAADITVGGAATKGSATLTGSGRNWTLETITVNNAGLANVSINKSGIEAAAKTVTVYKWEVLDYFPLPTITAWEYGAYTGKPLTVEFTGTIQVDYSWFTILGFTPIAGATAATYTPTEAGTYYVRATAKTDLSGSYRHSLSVVVAESPEYIDYLGQWLMKGVDNNWQPAPGVGYGYNETITLYADNFRLDSTYQNDYIEWRINSWTAITSDALPSGYTSGYTLAVTLVGNQGYTSYTSFNVYMMNNTGTPERISMQRANASGEIIERVYVKQ
jgi:hypothetical protein